MYLALFLAAMFYLYMVREEKQPFFKYGVLSAVLVLFPLTRWILNKCFQGFYEAEAWQWLLPVMGVIAFAVIEIWGKQWEKWKRWAIIPVACLVFLLCGVWSQDYLKKDINKNINEMKEVYDLILNQNTGSEILLVGPQEIMENARAYDGRIITVYGRDVWETDLDYAFYDHYDEWVYGLARHMEKPIIKIGGGLLAELSRSGATHVVFDKENLTFGDDMQYPATLESGGMLLKRMEETRHYVIYAR